MSHTNHLQSEIRSLDLARLTANALGFDLSIFETDAQRKHGVHGYYEGRIACDAAFKFPLALREKHAPFSASENPESMDDAIGLRKTDNGTYAFVFDAWGINANGSSEHACASTPIGDAFGTIGHWKWGMQKQANGHERAGHISTGTPHVFMHEYVLQTGELYARSTFMNSVRMRDEASGQTTLILTGGDLLPGEEIHVIAHADGTCTMAAVGFTGSRCKLATGPLESILGVSIHDELLGEYFHTADGEHIAYDM